MKIIKRIILLTGCLAMLINMPMPVLADFFSINAGCDGNLNGFGGGAAYNQKGIAAANKLPVNSVVQYIYAGTDEAIDPPDPVSGKPTHDDTLLMTKSIGVDNVWKNLPVQTGLFYNGVSGKYISGNPKVYVRVWNSSSISSASYYGDSGLLVPNSNSANAPTPNDIGIPNIITDKGFYPPLVIAASPNNAYMGDTLDINITGQKSHFSAGVSKANFGPGTIVNSTAATDETHCKANITITTTATAGAKNISVTTSPETVSGANLFTVSAPYISTITPTRAAQGWSGNITVSAFGTHFMSGNTTVEFGPGVVVQSIKVSTLKSFIATVSVESSAMPSTRDVIARTDLGAAGIEMVKRISSFTVSSTATVDSTVKFGCLYPVAGGGLEFAPFKDTALLFSMTLDDILLPGGYKNGKYIILNNTLDGTNYPAVKAVASSETSMIVLEHLPSYSLMPGHSTSFFPSIWVKGTAPNPETDPAKMPVNFISGADAGKYYQYGSTLNIPLTDQDKGKTVKIYFVANKDPIDCGTATASGDAILQDPRYVSLRWISWVDQPDSTAFVPKPMWTELNKTGSVSYFNTEAYYNGTDNNADDERNIISKVSLLQIPSAIPVTGLPNNNNPVVYNSARSSDLAGLGINTAGNIVQPGLACVYKPDAGSGKVKYLHIQIQINWPVVGVGRACSTAGCDLWVIKKVD